MKRKTLLAVAVACIVLSRPVFGRPIIPPPPPPVPYIPPFIEMIVNFLTLTIVP